MSLFAPLRAETATPDRLAPEVVEPRVSNPEMDEHSTTLAKPANGDHSKIGGRLPNAGTYVYFTRARSLTTLAGFPTATP